jgi:hypothetical protein
MDTFDSSSIANSLDKIAGKTRFNRRTVIASEVLAGLSSAMQPGMFNVRVEKILIDRAVRMADALVKALDA